MFEKCQYSNSELFDHLVGTGEQRHRYLETESPSGLEIDGEIELGRLLDRQIARLLALEDFAREYAHSPMDGSKADSMADQPNQNSKSVGKIDRRSLALYRLCDDLQTLTRSLLGKHVGFA
jgi:hypothetical protein